MPVSSRNHVWKNWLLGIIFYCEIISCPHFRPPLTSHDWWWWVQVLPSKMLKQIFNKNIESSSINGSIPFSLPKDWTAQSCYSQSHLLYRQGESSPNLGLCSVLLKSVGVWSFGFSELIKELVAICFDSVCVPLGTKPSCSCLRKDELLSSVCPMDI